MSSLTANSLIQGGPLFRGQTNVSFQLIGLQKETSESRQNLGLDNQHFGDSCRYEVHLKNIFSECGQLMLTK